MGVCVPREEAELPRQEHPLSQPLQVDIFSLELFCEVFTFLLFPHIQNPSVSLLCLALGFWPRKEKCLLHADCSGLCHTFPA